jgi:cell wall-associated NlpC family hydrolase
MARTRLDPLALAIVVGIAAGCASASGARPRPFPTPPGHNAPASEAAVGSADMVPAMPGGIANQVLSLALSLTGRPYRNGGADPSGFDCSGFVQYVFSRVGIGMPRTVADQFAVTASVGASSAADLLFFQTTAPGPTHVAIALGDGRFVHAPSSRGVVRVERLDAAYWRERLVAIRRALPDAFSPPGGTR